MDRTVKLNDSWHIINGKKKGVSGIFSKKRELPFSCDAPFILERKFICPKQVNDTVRIFFEGEYEINEVRASDKILPPEKDENGKVTYNITPALKTGKTQITASFNKGNVNGFFFSVKRTVNE